MNNDLGIRDRKLVIDLAFKLGVRFDPELFLKQKTFEQKQRRMSSFTKFSFPGIIVFHKKILDRFPIYSIVDLAKE